MGDELEQVLRGKMLHDVLYAIPISHPIAVEIDRLTAELAEVREEAKVWKDRYRKRGYVMDEHAKVLERAEVAEAELARYKQGVEVEGYISDDELGLESISMWDYRKRFKKGQRVRVLVMKEEE